MVDNVSAIPFIQAAPRSRKRINAKRTGRLARRYAASGVRTIDDSVIVCHCKCSERRARSLVGSRAYSPTFIIRDPDSSYHIMNEMNEIAVILIAFENGLRDG